MSVLRVITTATSLISDLVGKRVEVIYKRSPGVPQAQRHPVLLVPQSTSGGSSFYLSCVRYHPMPHPSVALVFKGATSGRGGLNTCYEGEDARGRKWPAFTLLKQKLTFFRIMLFRCFPYSRCLPYEPSFFLCLRILYNSSSFSSVLYDLL